MTQLAPKNVRTFRKQQVRHHKVVIEESYRLLTAGFGYDPFDRDAGIHDQPLAGRKRHRSSRASYSRSSAGIWGRLPIMARTCAASSLKERRGSSMSAWRRI